MTIFWSWKNTFQNIFCHSWFSIFPPFYLGYFHGQTGSESSFPLSFKLSANVLLLIIMSIPYKWNDYFMGGEHFDFIFQIGSFNFFMFLELTAILTTTPKDNKIVSLGNSLKFHFTSHNIRITTVKY